MRLDNLTKNDSFIRKITSFVINNYGMRFLLICMSIINITYLLALKTFEEKAALFFINPNFPSDVLAWMLKTFILVSVLLTGSYIGFRKIFLNRKPEKNRGILAYLPFALLFPVVIIAGIMPIHLHFTILLLKYSLAGFLVINVILFFNEKSINDIVTNLSVSANKHLGKIALLYFLIVSLLAVLRHFSINTHGYDLGIFDQVVWKYSKLASPFSSILSKNMLGEHFSPILMLLAPLYWIWSSPVVLLVAQTFFLALGGWILMNLAKKELDSPALIIITVLAYFGFPYLIHANLYDFHEVAFEVPILFAFFWAILNKKYLFSFLFGLLFLFCKEDTFLYLIGFSLIRTIMLLLGDKDKKEIALHTVLMVVAVIYGISVLKYIMPHFTPGHAGYNLARYKNLGNTFSEIAATYLFRFPYLIKLLFQSDRFVYLLRLFATLGFVPLLSPGYFLISIVPVAAIIFGQYNEFIRMDLQYALPIIPFLFLAYLFGMQQLEKIMTSENREKWLLPTVTFLACLAVLNIKVRDFIPLLPDRHSLAAYRMLEKVPPHASVSAQSDLAPHFSQRDQIYNFPDIHNAQYIALDQKGNFWPLDKQAFDNKVTGLMTSPLYTLTYHHDGYVIFKRK